MLTFFVVGVVVVAINRQYYTEQFLFDRIHRLGGVVTFQTDPSWQALPTGRVHRGIQVDFTGTTIRDEHLALLRWLDDLQILNLSGAATTPAAIRSHDLNRLVELRCTQNE